MGSKPEYNSKEGKVKELCKNGRIGVYFLLDGEVKTAALKRENLVFLEGGFSQETRQEVAAYKELLHKKQQTAGSSRTGSSNEPMAPREPLVPWSELVKDLGDLNLDEFKAQYGNLGPDGRKVIVDMLQMEVEKKGQSGYDTAKARAKIAKAFGFMAKRQAETDVCNVM